MQSKIAVYLASGRPIVATDFGDYTHDPRARPARAALTAVAPAASPRGSSMCSATPRWPPASAQRPGPSPRELFGMDRNVDRYLDVYQRVLYGQERTAPLAPLIPKLTSRRTDTSFPSFPSEQNSQDRCIRLVLNAVNEHSHSGE